MANTLVDDHGGYYSCRCLNIHIRPARTETTPPDPATEGNYIQVFVGDEGIIVAHPQVTLRIRTRGVPIAGTSRCSRFTAVTCLLCDTLVYRVHQVIPVDVEGKDGPVLPTEEWVEREIMKSSSGWIQVHRGCLTGNAITDVQSSADYSQSFSVVVPPSTSPPSSPALETDNQARAASPPVSPKCYLSHLRPLFPPAPFTPSHPVFFHLSTLAVSESDALRSAAEQHIANIVKEKVAEIEQAEGQLVQQVQILWKRFRRSIHKVEGQRRPSITRSPARLNDGEHWTVDTPTPGTPVAIRDFVPVSIPPARVSPASVPKLSALSASIATSSFHHPKALTSPAASPPGTPSGSTRRHSSTYSESLSLNQSSLEEGSTVLQLPRNTNDTINTAASYRYFLNLEEDMARHREQQKKTPNPSAPEIGPATGSQTLPNTNGKTNHTKQSATCSSDEGSPATNKKPESEVSLRGRDPVKGKRKVTFDVQPAVVTIKREVNAEQEEEALLANQDTGEMIFDLEDEGSDRSTNSQAVLPLIEQPSLSRPARARKSNPPLTNGLPESFSRLRPSSLPAPSHIRPPRGQHGTDSSIQPLLHFAKPPIVAKGVPNQQEPISSVQDDIPIDPRDAEILRLVAADTPSHRGAWKPNSKAWQTFVRRQDMKDSARNGNIPEEGEDDSLNLGPSEMRNPGRYNGHIYRNGDEEHNATVGSLPIPINLLLQPRETLSLASYQPKTSLADRPGILVPPLPTKLASSVALRKAAYAERDRTRSMDPGALDFAGEEYDEDDDDDDDADNGATNEILDSGGRGRKQALKILQARSTLPEAGMWRSLAS